MAVVFKQELLDLIREYEKISNKKFLSKESTKHSLYFVNSEGKKVSTSPASIKKYIEFKTGNKPIKIKDLFKIEAPVKIKKQWKAISCSMTTDELAIIDKLMKDNNIKTYNKFIRLVLLKVIEANK